jgi:hypothetical protein
MAGNRATRALLAGNPVAISKITLTHQSPMQENGAGGRPTIVASLAIFKDELFVTANGGGRTRALLAGKFPDPVRIVYERSDVERHESP